MSLYNLLFGRNRNAALLLAVVGLRENDIDRFRDVSASEDGSTIMVYSRTGGGNRESYPNTTMRNRPEWKRDEDDDFDSTYCTDYLAIPEQWRQDVRNLTDIVKHGIRAEFMQHLALTLRREPTDGDLHLEAYEAESAAIARLRGVKANGHTFVPFDDTSMEAALKLAEAHHDGKLISCWGIMPLTLVMVQNHHDYQNAKDARLRTQLTRVRIDYKWKIDRDYWTHCQLRFAAEYPKAMAVIAAEVAGHLKNEIERR